MDAFDYWRFCDELTVKQAVLLILSLDPGDIGEYVDGWEPHKRPVGYTAVLSAMQHAIISERLRAAVTHRDLDYQHSDVNHPVARIDWHATRVLVDDLKDWLTGRGARPPFFFPYKAASVEYLDPQHPHFSQKLAAVVSAWKAVSEERRTKSSGRSVKADLIKWLNLHAPAYGLSDEEGNPNVSAIEEVAKVANWDLKGGAPKTPAN